MHVYFAPMQGVTDAVYRRVHRRHFSGVEKYFIPFVSPGASLTFTQRELYDLSPVQNASVPTVPQILCNDPGRFNAIAQRLRDAGYREVNLNLGCPSGTVASKHRGSGLLKDHDALKRLLDGIFSVNLLPVSVKTRIGYESTEEWPRLSAIYAQYPISELIVHPRTRLEYYNGTPHRDACLQIGREFIYNGDLFTAEDVRTVTENLPGAVGVMLGRGLAANPALARQLAGGDRLSLEEIRSFHDDLYSEYLRIWPESAVVGRMHLMMKYMCSCFEDGEKALRRMRRADSVEKYNEAARILFCCHALKTDPAFRLDLLLG